MSCLRSALRCSSVSVTVGECGTSFPTPQRIYRKIISMTAVAEQTLCSKCGKEPRVAGTCGGVLCRTCIAAYMREYRKISGGRKFRNGAEAMRSLAIERFVRIGPRGMTGLTAAEIMRDLVLDH